MFKLFKRNQTTYKSSLEYNLGKLVGQLNEENRHLSKKLRKLDEENKYLKEQFEYIKYVYDSDFTIEELKDLCREEMGYWEV